jgi:hypothetical protein
MAASLKDKNWFFITDQTPCPVRVLTLGGIGKMTKVVTLNAYM